MTDQHPITPPPELFKQWQFMTPSLALKAAYRAGADQELEACCGWIESKSELGVLSFTPELRAKYRCQVSDQLRAARRPKPPSLAEQALEALEVEDDSMPLMSLQRSDRFALIRRALERLQDLEGEQ